MSAKQGEQGKRCRKGEESDEDRREAKEEGGEMFHGGGGSVFVSGLYQSAVKYKNNLVKNGKSWGCFFEGKSQKN
ncbi:MAG: hypothetical protein OHK0019_22270 [Saprospiraceae bacterium]